MLLGSTSLPEKINIFYFRQEFPFYSGLKIAGGGAEVVTKKEAVFLMLITPTGDFGIGEASYVFVKDRIIHDIDKDIGIVRELKSLDDLKKIILGPSSINPRLRFGLSVAYFDLISKMQGASLCNSLKKVFNCDQTDELKAKIVIFEDDLCEFQKLVRNYTSAKIKISPSSFDKVVETIIANPNISFALDANGSFTGRLDLVSALNDLYYSKDFKIEYLEQPLASKLKGGFKLLMELKSKCINLNFGLDQDLRVWRDFVNWSKLTDSVWVLKASVLGSVFELARIVKLARKTMQKIVLGGMFETVVGKVFLAHLHLVVNPDFPSEISPVDRYFYESWILNDHKGIDFTNDLNFLVLRSGLGLDFSDAFLSNFKILTELS